MNLLQEKLQRLVKESECELIEIGLGDKLNKHISYTINYRAKHRFGQCRNKKDINISSWLLEVGTDEDIKNTIIHEILHTFDDTKGHNAKWKYYANYVSRRTNYDISRCSSIDEVYEKANVVRPIEETTYKWKITCQKCGCVWQQEKMTTRVLNQYRNKGRIHRKCGCHDFKVENLQNGAVYETEYVGRRVLL